MPWNLRYHDDDAVVETFYTGAVTAQDLTEAYRATAAALLEHQCLLLLANCTGLTAPPSFFDLIDLVGSIIAEKVPLDFREAVVLPEKERSRLSVRFFETVSRNRGLNVRIFSTREEALTWLFDGSGRGPRPLT
ncbi:MAG: hypothetical protein F9K22_09975 [Bacteroidetes bacterium]|nr:MAG: hypothetical protein F9K22_09975 [Bacteroidota bacterium]